ncbi:hypothetical protein [Cellulophaga sp. RHA19]|uniref:hypothetical protein n=1 Tax=Cellulophaga sp. RHA19 TaxID=1798237 RepID=UPI001E5058F4|nr:hypothetical protein [Cellulophaga sp. RHA19]
MMKYIKILVLLLTLSVYGQNATEIKTPENANEKFIEFIVKKKFYAENHSPNISDEKLRPILTEKINRQEISRSNKNWTFKISGNGIRI